MGALFHSLLYQPIFNGFVALYNFLPGHDVGVVILVITILIRLVLWPFTSTSIKAQKSMQELQPKLEAIKKQFSGNKQQTATATMALYREHKVNPLSSCLPILIQLPILIALYLVLRDGLASKDLAENLYAVVKNPGTINPLSLGLFNMQNPQVALAILAGLAQYWQTKMFTRRAPPPSAGVGAKDENMMVLMNKQMLYFMPVLTAIIGMSLPAGLTLYWFLSTALMGLQQKIMFKRQEANGSALPAAIEGEIV